MAQLIEASLTAVDQASGPISHHTGDGAPGVSIFGTFVGTAVLERSLDGGQTYRTLASKTAAAELTSTDSSDISNPVVNAIYRVRCSAYTSGTIQVQML